VTVIIDRRNGTQYSSDAPPRQFWRSSPGVSRALVSAAATTITATTVTVTTITAATVAASAITGCVATAVAAAAAVSAAAVNPRQHRRIAGRRDETATVTRCARPDHGGENEARDHYANRHHRDHYEC
jgi:hypothetical protein